MKDSEFYLKVAQSLSGCQLVEQELKLYISEAFELVRKCVGNTMPFKMSGEDYADSSLERLIDAFRKLSDNQELVASLRRFKDERNYLSHKAIASCLDPDGELDVGSVAEVDVRLDNIQIEAVALRRALHEEANRFRGHLYFDDIKAG